MRYLHKPPLSPVSALPNCRGSSATRTRVRKIAEDALLDGTVQLSNLFLGGQLKLNGPSQVRAPSPPAKFSARCVRGRGCLANSPPDPPDTAVGRPSLSSSCSPQSLSPAVPSASPALDLVGYLTSRNSCQF